MHDDDWALFDLDVLDDEDNYVERPPIRWLNQDYARPATGDPRAFKPGRLVLDGPSVDDYEPAIHTEGIAR